MLHVRETDEFSEWLSALRDSRARSKILVRIARLANGNPGDVQPVGDKSSQDRDIAEAKRLAAEYED